MRKTSFVVMALSAVFMAMALLDCSVWAAGGLPQVEIKGNIMVFPQEDQIANLDLSKFATGRGLENVPQMYKHLIGNVYRAEWTGGHGYKWYIFLQAYVDKGIKFLVKSSAFGFPFIIVCPEDNEKEEYNCYVQGAKEGSISGFDRYKIVLKKGLPVIYQNNQKAEFYEAGKLPVLEVILGEPAPKKEQGELKIQNGIISFSEEDTPSVNMNDLKLSFAPDSPAEIKAIQGKIYGSGLSSKGQAIYLIPLDYDTGTKTIKLLYVTNNRGTQWKPAIITAGGVYNGLEGSALKPVNDKSDKPWVHLYTVLVEKGVNLRLLWASSGSVTNLRPVAELSLETSSPIAQQKADASSAQNLPESISAFLGTWEGYWGGQLGSRLLVEKIDTKEARCVYSWDSSSSFKEGSTRVTAKVDEKKASIEWGSGTKFIFTMSKDHKTIDGRRESPNDISTITMKKKK
jgi:hypothetical protein